MGNFVSKNDTHCRPVCGKIDASDGKACVLVNPQQFESDQTFNGGLAASGAGGKRDR